VRFWFALSRTILAPALAGLWLCACPSQTPPASQFARAGADAANMDLAVAASDGAGAADAAAGAEAGATGDGSTGADSDAVGDAPAAGFVHVCAATSGLGLYAKPLDNGANDLIAGIAAAADGGAVVVGKTGNAGTQTDVWAARTSAVGSKVWSKAFSAPAEDDGRAVVATGGGFALAAMTRSKGAGNADGWLLRLDGDGKLLWDKVYGGAGLDEFFALAPTQDGGFVLAGLTRSVGNGLPDGWLVRTDSDGGVLFDEHYGGSQIDELYGVAALPDGRFAATGSLSSNSNGGTDLWLLVTDAKGKQVLSKPFGKIDSDDGRAIAVAPDGTLVLTGTAGLQGNPELWTMRVDTSGALLWQHIAKGNQGEVGRAVAVLPDGGAVVVGETNSPLPTGGSQGYDGWLLRYDAWGNLLWDRRLGAAGNEWLTGVAALADGGLLVAGRLFDGASSAFNGWLVRTDPWGHSDCNKLGACKTKAAADCDDGQPCTADGCEPIDGCVHGKLADQSACGKAGLCAAGTCVGN